MISRSNELTTGENKLSESQVWFSFSGRINRTTYWLLGVVQLAAAYICIALLLAVILPHLSPSLDTYIILVTLVLVALSLWIGLAVSVKRWHDRNKSAWWVLVLAIPVAGVLWTLVELGFLAGRPTDEQNRYGHPQG